MKDNKSLMYSLFVLLVLIIGAGGFFFGSDLIDDSDDHDNLEVVEDNLNTISYVVTIEEADGSTTQYDLSAKQGSVLFDELVTLAEEDATFTMTSDEFEGIGAFLTSVNTLEPDPSLEFIEFVVNDAQAPVGVSDYVIQEGDMITFRIAGFGDFEG